MADTSTGPQRRSNADKERSRQQSRNVTGKEAARSTANRRNPGSDRNQKPSKQGQQAGNRQGRSATGGRGASGPSRRPASGRPPNRRPAGRPGGNGFSRYVLIGVAVVVVVVGVIVGINLSSSPSHTKSASAGPLSATILHQVTHIKTSVYNSAGTGSSAGVTSPTVQATNKALEFTGKPGLLYVGGEFCPFCAAERWAIIASLSRFGTFAGVQTMASSAVDSYPNTQTFTFVKATYKSTYFNAHLVEYYGQEVVAGTHPIIGKLTSAERAALNATDKTAATSSSTNGVSIPFIDIGNKVVLNGASYNPQILQGLSRAEIAGDLSDASNPVTQAIAGTSNYISAGICAMDGAKPANVCTSSGVKAATSALKLSS